MTIHFGNEKLDKFYGANQETIEAPTTQPAMNHYWRINGHGKFSLRKGNVKTDLRKCINQSQKNTLIVDIIRSIDHYVRTHYSEQIHKLKEECDALIHLACPDEIDVLKTVSRHVSSECFSHFKRRIEVYQIQNEFDGFLASQPKIKGTDRVIFVNRRDLTKPEGRESLYLYTKKHPSTRVVFDETSLRSLLNKLEKYNHLCISTA